MNDPRKTLTVQRAAMRDPAKARAALADVLDMIEFEQGLPGIANIRQTMRINDDGHTLALNGMLYAMLTGNYGFCGETMRSPIMGNLLTAARLPMIADEIERDLDEAEAALREYEDVTGLHRSAKAAETMQTALDKIASANRRACAMPPQTKARPLPYPDTVREAPASADASEAPHDLPAGRVRNGNGDVMPFGRSVHTFTAGAKPSEGIAAILIDAAGKLMPGVTLDISEGTNGGRIYVQADGQADISARKYCAFGRAGVYDVRKLRTAINRAFPDRLTLAEIAKLNRRDASAGQFGVEGQALPALDIDALRKGTGFARRTNGGRVLPSRSCHVCGRELDGDAIEFEMNTSGDLIVPGSDPDDSLGVAEVGTGCAKKIPAAYRVR